MTFHGSLPYNSLEHASLLRCTKKSGWCMEGPLAARHITNRKPLEAIILDRKIIGGVVPASIKRQDITRRCDVWITRGLWPWPWYSPG